MPSELLINAKPKLNVKEFQDLYLRKNFENLVDYFKTENQLLGFQFFEMSFSSAINNQKISHNLGTIPGDIIVTRISGTGVVQFNWGLFDNRTLDVNVTGPCRVRFFAGSYWNFNTALNNAPSDLSQFSSLAQATQSQSSVAQLFPTYKAVTDKYSSTIEDANNVVLVDGNINVANNPNGAELKLPSLAKAAGTGFYSYQKSDSTFNGISIFPQVGDFLDFKNLTKIRLSTQGEKVTLLPTKDRWILLERNYRENWVDLGWVAATLTTNALVNPITLNSPALSPKAIWRRDGAGIRIRFGWQNGTPGASGTPGIISLPLVPGAPADVSQLIVSTNGISQNGFASVNRAETLLDSPPINIPAAGGGLYMDFPNQGSSSYYTLGNVNNNFGITGEVFYLVSGWEG